MHDIAKFFSNDARRAVCEAFAPGKPGKYIFGGNTVEYDGLWCCPIGVALLADGKGQPSPHALERGDYTPDASDIVAAVGEAAKYPATRFINEYSLNRDGFTEESREFILKAWCE